MEQKFISGIRGFWDRMATRHALWFTILALILLVIFPLVLNIWINVPELFRRAPYEDWDEICSYNHTRQMTWDTFKRVPSYGALDTFEFVLARKWHETFDRKAQILLEPLWANGVPGSFQDYKLLLGNRKRGSYAAIDYNYARGVCDRSVIITARKIDFSVTYLLLGLFLSFVIFTLGCHGIALCVPVTWFLFSYEFRWTVVRALPGAQTTILAGIIFYLLLMALKNRSLGFCHVATALCAISSNLKADSLMMGFPIFLTYLLVHCHTYSGIVFRKFAVTSFIAAGLFAGTLVLTNPELAIRPHAVIKNQVQLLSAVGSGQRVKLRQNVRLFGDFLHYNLVSPFLGGLSAKSGWKWVFLWAGLGATGLYVALAKSPTPAIRFSMILLTTVGLGVLWGMPIVRAPTIYGRYFASGLIVMFVAFGFSFYLFARSFRVKKFLVVWGVLSLGTICCIANSRSLVDESQSFRRQLAENFGLDPAMSRNRATIAIWNLLKTGKYDEHVIIDQHSYTDLRFFFDRDVPVVMINAWNFRKVLDGLKDCQRPVLGLHVPGAYADKSVPSWVGAWTPEWAKNYDDFHEELASFPRVYDFDGNRMKLLDWSPVLEGDSAFVFTFDPNR
jgi:hypothetical protein